MVRRLEEELDSANGESWHLSAELVRTTAWYEHAQEHTTKTMAEVATLTGDLEEANLTIHGHALRNIDLMSRLDALRHQLDVVAIDKEFLHASTQTDPLPSVVTSLSLVAGRKSPPLDDDAPDMPPDSPSDGMDLPTPKDGKSAFRRQLKYKRKLGAASVTPSSMPTTPETPDSNTQTPRSRTKEQYVNIKNTKMRIRLGEIVIQMDFAEKFMALEFFKNIQGVHWAKNLVTIHTVVVYFLSEGVEGVQHKSYVYLSPVDQHNTIMIWAILKLIGQCDLPRFFKDQKFDFVHYVTDGPGSQYKNQFIFWMVANHPEMFGCRAVWHYLETGHGKGPCDGVWGFPQHLQVSP